MDRGLLSDPVAKAATIKYGMITQKYKYGIGCLRNHFSENGNY